MYIYVQAQDGTPLMPTQRAGKVRRMLRDGRWKRNQAPREIKGFRLFDIILHNNIPAYIHGRRSSGYFVVKDFEGKTLSNSASYKSLELIRHNNNQMFIDKISDK